MSEMPASAMTSASPSFCTVMPLANGIFQCVEQHGSQDKSAQYHLGVVRRQAHQIYGCLNGMQEQHAGIDARQLTDAALQADTADDDGGKSLEQHPDAEIGRGS